MTVVLCLDDRNGMAFNHRRQSRDRVVTAHMLTDGVRYAAPAAVSLFPPDTVQPVEDLKQVPEDGVCFVEQPPLAPVAHRITRLIVYRWNRVYPADTYCDLPLERWTLTERTEFPGHSHPNLTREVYIP